MLVAADGQFLHRIQHPAMAVWQSSQAALDWAAAWVVTAVAIVALAMSVVAPLPLADFLCEPWILVQDSHGWETDQVSCTRTHVCQLHNKDWRALTSRFFLSQWCRSCATDQRMNSSQWQREWDRILQGHGQADSGLFPFLWVWTHRCWACSCPASDDALDWEPCRHARSS